MSTVAAPLLDEAVRRLVAAVGPERIWLYGSRARGDHDERSDWDLMVVMPGHGAVPRETRDTACAAVADLPATIDLHVEPHGWFHDRLHLAASFPSTIAREGIILWQTEDLAAEDGRRWLERARGDLAGALTLLATGEPAMVPMAVGVLQEAAEKAGKSLLALHDVPVRRTHDLAAIGGALRRAEPEAARILRSLAGLPQLALLMRYPSEVPAPDEREMERLASAVRSLVELAASRLDPG